MHQLLGLGDGGAHDHGPELRVDGVGYFWVCLKRRIWTAEIISTPSSSVNFFHPLPSSPLEGYCQNLTTENAEKLPIFRKLE